MGFRTGRGVTGRGGGVIDVEFFWPFCVFVMVKVSAGFIVTCQFSAPEHG